MRTLRLLALSATATMALSSSIALAQVSPGPGGGGSGGGGTSSSFSATFPATGTAAGAEYLAAPPTLTNGQMVPFFVDANGNLKVNIVTGAGSGGTAITDNTAFTQGAAGGTNETPVSCLFKTAYTAATSGNSTVVRCDSSGQLLVAPSTCGGVEHRRDGGGGSSFGDLYGRHQRERTIFTGISVDGRRPEGYWRVVNGARPLVTLFSSVVLTGRTPII